MTSKFTALRREAANIQHAQAAGTHPATLVRLAEQHKSPVIRIAYRQLEGIFCDTMAVYQGQTFMTLENLQYYPAKIYGVIIPNQPQP